MGSFDAKEYSLEELMSNKKKSRMQFLLTNVLTFGKSSRISASGMMLSNATKEKARTIS